MRNERSRLLRRQSRRGFSLLEVMIALGILVMSLAILIQAQVQAAELTMESERILAASHLAKYKLSEVQVLVEEDGFSRGSKYESGDFDDFGDDALNLEFDDLDEYRWEYWISEVDVKLAGDMASTASELQGNPALGGNPEAGGDMSALGGLGGMAGGMMSPEMVSEMLVPYIREVRVRVYWGEDSKEAEERGDDVIVVGHAINPGGALQQAAESLPL